MKRLSLWTVGIEGKDFHTKDIINIFNKIPLENFPSLGKRCPWRETKPIKRQIHRIRKEISHDVLWLKRWNQTKENALKAVRVTGQVIYKYKGRPIEEQLLIWWKPLKPGGFEKRYTIFKITIVNQTTISSKTVYYNSKSCRNFPWLKTG